MESLIIGAAGILSNSAVVSAVVAGIFIIVNTVITILLTSYIRRQEQKSVERATRATRAKQRANRPKPRNR